MADEKYTGDPGQRSAQSRLADAIESFQEDSKTIARLLGEMVGEAQNIVRNELDKVKEEALESLNKARQGAILLALGVGLMLVGGALLILMLVHLLVSLLSISIWQSYLLVGGAMAGVGLGLLYWGSKLLENIRQPVRQQGQQPGNQMQKAPNASPAQ